MRFLKVAKRKDGNYKVFLYRFSSHPSTKHYFIYNPIEENLSYFYGIEN